MDDVTKIRPPAGLQKCGSSLLRQLLYTRCIVLRTVTHVKREAKISLLVCSRTHHNTLNIKGKVATYDLLEDTCVTKL